MAGCGAGPSSHASCPQSHPGLPAQASTRTAMGSRQLSWRSRTSQDHRPHSAWPRCCPGRVRPGLPTRPWCSDWPFPRPRPVAARTPWPKPSRAAVRRRPERCAGALLPWGGARLARRPTHSGPFPPVAGESRRWGPLGECSDRTRQPEPNALLCTWGSRVHGVPLPGRVPPPLAC